MTHLITRMSRRARAVLTQLIYQPELNETLLASEAICWPGARNMEAVLSRKQLTASVPDTGTRHDEERRLFVPQWYASTGSTAEYPFSYGFCPRYRQLVSLGRGSPTTNRGGGYIKRGEG